jgi:hypothetical protein
VNAWALTNPEYLRRLARAPETDSIWRLVPGQCAVATVAAARADEAASFRTRLMQCASSTKTAQRLRMDSQLGLQLGNAPFRRSRFGLRLPRHVGFPAAMRSWRRQA